MTTTPPQLPGLRRGLEILRAVALGGSAGTTFGALQATVPDLTAPALSRILKVLLDERYLARDTARGLYQKGEKLRELSRMVVGTASRAELLQPVVESLAARTHHSAAYFEYDPGSNSAVLVAKAEQPDSCHYIDRGAGNTAVARHAFAQVILAYGDSRAARHALARSSEPPAIPDKAFLERLDQIRSAGFFVELSESRSTRIRFAAPVFEGASHRCAGAVGFTVIADRLAKAQHDTFLHDTIDTAGVSSRLLGGDYKNALEHYRTMAGGEPAHHHHSEELS